VVVAGRSRERSGTGGDVLWSWAGKLSGRAGKRARGMLRFAFYGRVPAEDWQDPVTSRARQLQQGLMLAAGAGVIAAEFSGTGESRELPWARRPQAAALVAQLAGPPAGAATGTPARPSPIPRGRRTPMSARIRSCRTWPLSPSCSPRLPGYPDRTAADPLR
jgi:hypothetical protein